MAFSEMIVTNASGIVKEEEKGQIITAINDPFTFYAVNMIGGGIVPLSDDAQIPEVKMVMPLGGTDSGLFRHPRIGDRILVAAEAGGINYLMGYMPSTAAQNFNIEEDDPEKAEVFRYQQTGRNTDNVPDGEEYSEIGFYHRQTFWKAAEDDRENYADADDDYPKIDHINIHSTGDIHENAVNHHQISAKRFELLVDCDDIRSFNINAKEDNSKKGEDPEEGLKLPLGDNPGDDSELHKGDVHIRAGNRVVIKAEEEIQLQVGRTILTISDEGFNVTSRQTCSNFATTYDATLEIQPRGGISMSGKNIEINAGHELNVGDAMGGSFASTLGVLEIKGREIQIEAYDQTEFAILEAGLGFKLAQALVSIGLFKNNPTRTDVLEYYDLTNEFVQNVANSIREIVDAYSDGELGGPSTTAPPPAGAAGTPATGTPTSATP
ncbi:MAG: hypothetical protein LBP76_14280 [Treponema sp.]|jgi:hypothetical protein|nr:hypothetical protein [Treponema sp.]